MRSRTFLVKTLAALAVAPLVGCGAPGHGVPVTITRVPYDLTSPSRGSTATPAPAGTTRLYLYLVRDQVVVPVRARSDRPNDPAAAVTDVLAQLTNGPSERDRAAGLATALGPGTSIRLEGITEGVATVDLAPGNQVPAASRAPLAVAQVVLSVTSVPGVDEVLVTRDGEPVELPLPGGALTGSPVGARDYVSLTGSGTSGTATTGS